MSARDLLQVLAGHASQRPDAIAIHGTAQAVSYAELAEAVSQAARHLRETGPRVIGLAMDNGPAWATVDLAAMQAGIALVPLPFFFSASQMAHAIADAGIDCVYTDQPELFDQLFAAAAIDVGAKHICRIHGQNIVEFMLASPSKSCLPAGTLKVTYTSGTTGSPKGVCLGMQAIGEVAESLLTATQASPADRHLSLLPLSTLLENIAGLYVPLLAGASTTLLPFAEIGLKGATGLDVQQMAGALLASQATSTILTPELLRALVAVTEAGHPLPPGLRFVAVGGAPVAEQLIKRARHLGIPVFEGYGLSECASVVALNTPAADRVGSAGKPLPHVTLEFAEDGEILVGGATLLGYTGNAQEPPPALWPTGDRGHLDAQGFLHITGRKKNIFITSFGRNVSPEWVERELTLYPCIAQAAVFGEKRPWNVAVIVPRGNGAEVSADIDRAIADANTRLPDYARVQRWIAASAPFTPQGGQLTANGRLRRDAISAAYQTQIDSLYEETDDVVL